MRFLAVVFGLLLFLTGCQSAEKSPPSAQAVVDSAIAAHGGSVLDRAVVSFDFRGDQYQIRHDDGRFLYQRTYADSADRTITEGLHNEGVYRIVEGDTVDLAPEEIGSVESTVNSVSYFALLPYRLGDPAVQPHYHGRDTIEGASYHRIKVTFDDEAGGDDWDDVYMYWFQTEDYEMDYLAYAYGLDPDEEMGTRFREAYNVRRPSGVRVADYMNYTSDTLRADQLHQYPELWSRDALELVSQVEIDSVRVRPLSSDS